MQRRYTSHISSLSIIIIPLFEEELINYIDVVSVLIKSLEDINGYDAIIFFTLEEFPRGDFIGSIYNRSRIIREFLENTTFAKTANLNNIIEKIEELITEIKIGNDHKKKVDEAINELIVINSTNSLIELSNIYTFQNFHTLDAHNRLREFKSALENNHIVPEIVNKYRSDYYQKRQLHDIASIISVNPKRFSPLKILVIDDNKEVIKDLQKILNYLPVASEIYLTDENEYKKFIYDKNFIQGLYNKDVKLNLIKISSTANTNAQQSNNDNSQLKDLFTAEGSKKFFFDYVIVDLLLGPYNEGNKIIRELVKFRDIINRKAEKHYEKSFFFILALSLSDDVDDVFRAFNEGALGYVWKFNRIYHLPYLIGSLEPARQALIKGKGITAHSHARNFSKLYHLPPLIEWKLRTEPFLQPLKKKISGREVKEIDDLAKEVAKNWIKQVPKAELHYHLGGSMDENIIFYLSVNTVAHLYKKLGEKLSVVLEEIKNLINYSKSNNQVDIYEKYFRAFYQICQFILEKDLLKKRISNLIGKINKRDYNKIKSWLVNILNTKKNIIEYLKKFEDKPAELWFDYLEYKFKNSNIDIKKIDLIPIFFVYVGLLEGRNIKDAQDFFLKIKDALFNLTQKFVNTKSIFENTFASKCFNQIVDNEDLIPILTDQILNNLNQLFNGTVQPSENSLILRSLVRASNEAKTLNQLLRGDVFFGADNLQYYENIFACVWYLMEKAIEDNVRYLEIRVSPSGYTKKDLSLDEATNALFDGADLCSLYYYLFEGKFIWTNFITSAKRHKSPSERAEEISLAIVKGKREKLISKLENKFEVYSSALPYRWRASKIVGVDLTGYEKDTPPEKFYEDFLAAQKECKFITIHAGEEATADYIWQAVFKLHANRIGHGLSITQHNSLMDLARDTQICIELCPISNMYTNNLRGERITKYPLYKFLKEGLNVTINTDDCATTGTTLSDDYVKAA
ncbi:MAG: hypothetical protein QW244_03425, partial [Candidatus Pacearchaeota archaeon]